MADILIISSNAKDWSKDSGGKERTSTLAEGLDGHNVIFLSFNWHGVNKIQKVFHNITHVEIPIEEIVQRKYLRLIRSAAQSNYDSAVQMLKPELQKFSKMVYELSGAVDLVILDHYATAPFLDSVKPGVPIVYNSHNSELTMAQQLYPLEAKAVEAVKTMESLAVSKAKAITYCSKDDIPAIKKNYTYSASEHYIPNGAEIPELVDPMDRFLSKEILFVGSGHPPNAVAAKNLLPVSDLVPDYDFVLCGGAGNALKKVSQKNLKALGHVDDEKLTGLFKTAFAFINPMESGSGTHLKVMKALSHGMPIITSSVGARGFSQEEIKKSMIIANTTDEMVSAIVSLQDEKLYKSLCDGAREIGETYDWEIIKRKYLDVINSVISLNPVRDKKENVLAPQNKKSVLIYSIIRNRGATMGRYFSQLKACVDANPQYDFYLSIYENDSTDSTKKNLFGRDLSFFRGVSIISEDINTEYFGSIKDATRVENLAKARNKAIEAGGFLDLVDYVLMIEGDVEYNVDSFNKLLNFEQVEPDFDIVSSISLRKNGIHYDWWATRTTPIFDETKSEIEPDYKKKDYGRYYSTSNGLCLYRAKPFQEGIRHGWINTATGEFDCEMVVLCQSFHEAGHSNIFINYKSRAVH